jgi:flavin reductase (DIM6/NTAB) family NADH-FMN oxidoreductase RutF
MASFQSETTATRYFFQLFSGSLVPRPIAWITTINEDQTINLAPYSFFGGVNTRPPMVMVSIGRHEGQLKHTGQNITRTNECVIHIPSQQHIEVLNKSAYKFEKGISEVEVLDLSTISSEFVTTPSLADTLVRFECKLHKIVELPTNDMFIFDVVNMVIDDSVIKEGIVDIKALNPVSRIGGNFYTLVGDVIQKPHPDNEFKR